LKKFNNLQNCRCNGRRDGRNCSNKGEEDRSGTLRTQPIMRFQHLWFLSKSRDEFFHLGKQICPSAESLPDLMTGIYVKRRFAKMTALPDNLTETPHLNAGRSPEWTFSMRS
jgi:hypothetical protein